MKTLREKSFKVMNGTKTYRLLEREASDMTGRSSDCIKYVVEGTYTNSGYKADELDKAIKDFENISSVTNWI